MRFIKSLTFLVGFVFLIAAAPKTTAPMRTDWKDVEQAIGRAGTLLPGDVYKVGFPRGDLAVTSADRPPSERLVAKVFPANC